MCFGVYAGADLAGCAAIGADAWRVVHRNMQTMPSRQTAISPIVGPSAIGVLFCPGSGLLRFRMRVVIRFVLELQNTGLSLNYRIRWIAPEYVLLPPVSVPSVACSCSFVVACSCRHSERVFRARRTPMNPTPPQPSVPFSRKTPPLSPCKKTSRRTLKNTNKSACQDPRCQKIPITSPESTTSLRKIVGILVMLRLIHLNIWIKSIEGQL